MGWLPSFLLLFSIIEAILYVHVIVQIVFLACFEQNQHIVRTLGTVVIHCTLSLYLPVSG